MLTNGTLGYFFRQFMVLATIAGLLILLFTDAQARDLRLATTTSTENSGLLRAILPLFEQERQRRVQVISVGTGKALKLGENGDVDVVLVHDRVAEDAFVAAGHGVNRRGVMYNDFVIVGPPDDPAAVRGSQDVLDALRRIAAKRARFVSRGDDSGTDRMERRYWQQIGIIARGLPWHVSSGLGMGEVLTMAGEMQAYALTDRATYATYKARTGLEILLQGDPRLFNPYGAIAVNPGKHKDIDFAGAMALIEWLASGTGRAAITAFRPKGEQLFFIGTDK